MKVVLSIAGSDSSGGAGIQADLKTFEAFGLFGTSVLTVLTAQNTQGVSDIYEVSPFFIKKQIESVFEDFDVASIKIGMLYSKEIIELIKKMISQLDIPIVLDPVCISKAGSPLLKEDAIEKMKELFEYATVITPNIYEAQKLFGYSSKDFTCKKDMMQNAKAVLVKNVGIDEKISSDYLFVKDETKVFQTPFIQSTNLHGTGCSFSSAIAANLALGFSLEEAIQKSKNFINEALLNAPAIGHGPGPINHKVAGKKVLS